MDQGLDWQTFCPRLKDRGEHLFQNGNWADCHFLVGNETNRTLLHGHKLLLAMASPVFDAMFNGGLPEKNDPIEILDVQPDAFRAMLEYIYTDTICITSMDKACELCYVAKKYMLPHVVEQCTKFLWTDLSSKNVCRAYEFANLFEEPSLVERCLQIICTQTEDMLGDPSFEEIELSTLLTIVDQKYLMINSELELFMAVARYAEKHGYSRATSKTSEIVSANIAGEGPSNQPDIILNEASIEAPEEPIQVADDAEQPPQPELQPQPQQQQSQQPPTFWDAVKKIRFLTMSPKQFAENVARSNILTQDEAFAILMNISSRSQDIYPMPPGFTTNTRARSYSHEPPAIVNTPAKSAQRVRMPPFRGFREEDLHAEREQMLAVQVQERRAMIETPKFYCHRTLRQEMQCFNAHCIECSCTFKVDRPICITGIQVPTQVNRAVSIPGMPVCNLEYAPALPPERYSELLYAQLLDSQGSRLTYTHCSSRANFDSMLEISFDRPVYIQRQKNYKISVVFNKMGWYPAGTSDNTIETGGITFTFNQDTLTDSLREGLIRTIIFTQPGFSSWMSDD